MERRNICNRVDLLNLIKKAKSRIRILGAVAFNLPYDDYKKDWSNKINAGGLQVEIICESESSLNYFSLISSNKRVSGENRSYDISNFMNIKNLPLQKVREYLLNKNCRHLEPKGENPLRDEDGNPIMEKDEKGEDKIKVNKEEAQFFSLRTSYLPIPIPVINIDDDYYIALSLTAFCDLEKFEKISEEHIWWNEFEKYFKVYFESDLGAKKYSTEITSKDNKTEVIIMYNDDRHVLGQLPRDSFLDTTKVKVVIWGMLFSRDGKVLIHQRGKNAKDNRGMWDKSIGGHVDLEKDTVDTTRAASREMLEELYKVEAEGQGDHSKSENMKIDETKPIFLGDWRPEVRFTFPFSEIKNKKDEMFFFRIKYDFIKKPVDSPRVLLNGDESPVKCCADVYAFVMPEGFEKTIGDLKNSKYKLLELNELNDAYKFKEIELEKNGEKVIERFNPTPDLKKIITGELWTEFNRFSDYLIDGIQKK
ncbi:MAG: NUDIX domain-containing protein [Tannerellaceae bacterium]|jgi:hypothetical protein|nr:NUDIX domain-containing protein [Tannerellaceae bacterium]